MNEPENTRHVAISGLKLVHRVRRWPNIQLTLALRLVFAEDSLCRKLLKLGINHISRYHHTSTTEASHIPFVMRQVERLQTQTNEAINTTTILKILLTNVRFSHLTSVPALKETLAQC